MTDSTSERIAKRLARAGIASRRGAEAMIAEAPKKEAAGGGMPAGMPGGMGGMGGMDF